jgi:PAS domain-containing protein
MSPVQTPTVLQRPKVLLFGARPDELAPVASGLRTQCDVISVAGLAEGLSRLDESDVDGVCVVDERAPPADFLLEAGGVLQQIPDGVAILDVESRVLWCNDRLHVLAGRTEPVKGEEFLDVFGTPEILGPDFCPVHTALGSGETARSTMRLGEKSYVQIEVTPVADGHDDFPQYLIAFARDVSEEVIQR